MRSAVGQPGSAQHPGPTGHRGRRRGGQTPAGIGQPTVAKPPGVRVHHDRPAEPQPTAGQLDADRRTVAHHHPLDRDSALDDTAAGLDRGGHRRDQGTDATLNPVATE